MASLDMSLKTVRKIPPTALFGLVVIAIYVFVAVFAPFLAPYPEREVVGSQYMAWSAAHPLGTDNLGRDMLSRLIYAARNTLGIAFATTVMAEIMKPTAEQIEASMRRDASRSDDDENESETDDHR